MSSYQNFVQDFPKRCSEILNTYDDSAKLNGREVTLMLAVASTGINVPFERLKPINLTRPSSRHPSNDRARYELAQQEFDQLLESKFLGSMLWENKNSSSWYLGQLSNPESQPDEWPELKNPNPITLSINVNSILTHIRNGLAHGNIFTKKESTISTIVFLRKPNSNIYAFDYLLVSPDEFRQFLKNWFIFLEKIKLS